MNVGRVVMAGAVAGVVSILTSWLITGGLFHRYQRLTPGTWRPEGPVQYATSSVLNVASCIGIALLLAVGGGFPVGRALGWPVRGLLFGGLCWAATLLPLNLTSAVYVNVDRRAVLGFVLDSLVLCLLAGTAGAWSIS